MAASLLNLRFQRLAGRHQCLYPLHDHGLFGKGWEGDGQIRNLSAVHVIDSYRRPKWLFYLVPQGAMILGVMNLVQMSRSLRDFLFMRPLSKKFVKLPNYAIFMEASSAGWPEAASAKLAYPSLSL